VVSKVSPTDSDKFSKWDLAPAFLMWKGMKKADSAHAVYPFKSHTTMSQRALTAHSPDEPKVTRWVNKACSWVHDKASPFFGGGRVRVKLRTTLPTTVKVKLLRVTEEIRKLKQKSGVQGSLIHAFWRSFFPYLASTYWCYRKAQKKATEPRFMPRPILSSLSDLSLISTLKNLYFQNKHNTISVNRENLT